MRARTHTRTHTTYTHNTRTHHTHTHTHTHTQSAAQKLQDQIGYEGKLLKVGRKGTSSIIAEAAMAARDASFMSDPAGLAARHEALQEQAGSGSRFHNHDFVRVFPKPFHFAAGAPQQKQAQRAVKNDEQAFLGEVNHEMHMKKLAADLKLNDKPSLAGEDSKAKSGASGDVLKSREDMDNGVDPEVPAAAAKRLALSRAATLDSARGSTNLRSSDEKDLLDNKGDMDNGVNTAAMQTAAQKLATSLVDKMQESAEAAEKKKQADEHEKEVIKARQDWAKANPEDDAKVAELKKELWRAEEAEGNTKGASAKAKVQSMEQIETKGETAADDKAEKEEKKKAEEHAKEVIKERQDWSKANPTDDAKVAELKKELWRAEAKAETPKGDAHKVVAMSQTETKGKAADGDKAKEEATVSEATKEAKKKNEATEEAKKQAAKEEHEKEVIKERRDWSKANPTDDAKVVELKKELWRAEEAEGKAHDKVATARKASAKGVKAAASAGRSIEMSGPGARGKLMADAMKSAVKNAISTVVDEMSAKPAVTKAVKDASKVASKVHMVKVHSAKEIEAMARGIMAASSALQQVVCPFFYLFSILF